MPRTWSALALAFLTTNLAVSQPPDAPKDKPADAPKDAPKDTPKAAPKDAPKTAQAFARFRTQEIDRSLKVGYAVSIADVNGDGKPDIVVVDTDRVVWYENPSWQRRTMIENVTKLDNVCIAAADIDGDGKIDFVLGAGWSGRFDTKVPSTLQWLRRGKTLDDPWEVHSIPCDEPTIHRVRFADVDGDGKPELLVAPLMGRDSSRAGNWTDGRPVRLLSFKIPDDPVQGPWVATPVDETLHVVHNLWPAPAEGRKGMDVMAASYEGVTLFARDATGHWLGRRLGEGHQLNPRAAAGPVR